MSQRELLVESNCTAEHLPGALEALAPKLVKQLPASEVELIGSRIACVQWPLPPSPRRTALRAPLVKLSANCVDSAQLEVQLTMHRKVFGALPSLHGANIPVQVGSNLLPPAQDLPLLGCRARSREVGAGNQGRGGGHDRLLRQRAARGFAAERRLCGRNCTPSLSQSMIDPGPQAEPITPRRHAARFAWCGPPSTRDHADQPPEPWKSRRVEQGTGVIFCLGRKRCTSCPSRHAKTS